ncbi:glycoside hydrolase family 18 protein [Polychaeton citri CBS 116435]|uniref:chitinase n=1 Tax=Polychaeton citri CBS 116435 TaxID=1314669 RepID=A0A9P4Q4U6_9PEZI|nr:glycoside hydrolase family 18 protein [Polychaeton citri CBS 116435]
MTTLVALVNHVVMGRAAEAVASVVTDQRTAERDVSQTVVRQLSVGSMRKLLVKSVHSTPAVCGTTADYCGSKCQSNCVLHPSPPGGGASVGLLQNRVIGYYESWSARKSCHKVTPTDLPLDALTHVNFAFAYISPGSYQVITMDGDTPSSLFQDVANLKSVKPDLKVFISIGGWTFSDNDTATQPIFGEIAASASNRQTFANNVVHFMRQYGFDGLDIDWEYPGAPDRGGKTEDTANFVTLLQTLKQTFDGSGSKFELTFTAPSSYWYLRWFDLPGMVKYADWVNLMTYDLHGVWDSTNPIGSIVQGHTNLTEIKLAAELFWRVGIAPAKVVMGFGFYGRSFTLADPSCTKPGCPFSGASTPGPCSNAGGILAYYEIMQIIHGSKKRSSVSPIHDTADAVNYMTYDGNQWISYDDAVTFKQKVDWANSVGLGGGLIWASDLDDDKYSAHAALLGRTVQSTSSLQAIDKALSNPQAVIQDLAGGNGQDCFAYKGKCVNLNDNNAMAAACGSGNTVVGWDDAGCGKKSCHCGKPICCPSNSAPKNCMWRGNDNGGGVGSDCSGQCAAGEVNIKGIRSSWGGGFTNDGNTNKCGRGFKTFCCANPDFQYVTKGCKYASCRSSCPTGTKSIFSKTDGCFIGSQQYCCPDPPQLTDCHWYGGTGGEECSNAVCKPEELEVDRAQFGGSAIGGCSWGRTKAACCTVSKSPPKPATCVSNLCTLLPGFCPNDNDDESANGWSKRSITSPTNDSYGEIHVLEERGGAETYYPPGVSGTRIIAVAYPLLTELFGYDVGAHILREFIVLIRGYCTGRSVDEQPWAPGLTEDQFRVQQRGFEAEHPIDRQVMKGMPRASTSGILPSGARANLPTIPLSFWQGQWNTVNNLLAARPAVGGPDGIQPDTPNDRVMESFGSYDYPYPLIPTDKMINGAKGRAMALNAPTGIATIRRLAAAAVNEDTPGDADELLQAVRVGFSVFEYLNTPTVSLRFNAVRQQIRLQFTYIEQDLGVPHLADWWDAYSDDYFELVGTRARAWATDAIHAAAAPYVEAHENGITLATYESTIGALEEMLEEVTGIRLPPSNTMPNPQPPGGGGS